MASSSKTSGTAFPEPGPIGRDRRPVNLLAFGANSIQYAVQSRSLIQYADGGLRMCFLRMLERAQIYPDSPEETRDSLRAGFSAAMYKAELVGWNDVPAQDVYIHLGFKLVESMVVQSSGHLYRSIGLSCTLMCAWRRQQEAATTNSRGRRDWEYSQAKLKHVLVLSHIIMD